MIKYFIANRHLVKVNTENLDKIDMIDYHPLNVNWLWIIDEDGEVDGKPVSKGDMVINFYDMFGVKDSRETVIVKDEALKDYYRRFDEARTKSEADIQNSCSGDAIPCTCCEKSL